MFTGMDIIRMAVGGLTLTLGIPGNITIIIAFVRQGINNATDFNFVALAVVDLFACITNGMKIPMVFFHDEKPWPCFIEIIGGRSALYAGLFLTIFIAFTRYQAICKPFERRIKRRAAILISTGCILLAFGIHVPFFFITTSKKFGGVKYGCQVYGNIPWGREVYSKFQAVVFCVSAIVIVILYLLIYKYIHAHQIIRSRMEVVATAHPAVSQSDDTLPIAAKSDGTQNEVSTDRSPKRSLHHQAVHERTEKSSKKAKHPKTYQKTTKVVIIITVLLFLLWCPSIVLDQVPTEKITKIFPNPDLRGIFLYSLYQVKYINNIINIFVYLFAYKRFRKTFCNAFSYCSNESNPIVA